MRRVARAALATPLAITGGILVLTLGSANVFAASSTGASANSTTHLSAASTPASSSRPHEHEGVECSPGTVSESHGQCSVTFVDKATDGEPHPAGQRVCFTVDPTKAGRVGTGFGAGNCAFVKNTASGDKALGTFTASGKYCGQARVIATEPAEDEQTHHTTITIICTPGATTTSAVIPAGSPLPPSGGGWLLGAMGVGAALVTGYALRMRRRTAPRRLAAR